MKRHHVFSSRPRLFALLLLLSFATGDLAVAQDAKELMEHALATGRSGRFDECAAEWTAMIKHTPKVPDAVWLYVERADAYVHGGHYDEAWADLTEAVALDPKIGQAYYLQGIILDSRRDAPGAIAAYSKAIALNPKDEASLYNRGCDLSVSGSQDAAIADYTRAIAVDDKNASFYLNRGASLATQGKGDAALADFAKAINLKPHEMTAYVDRAEIYLRRQEWAQAIKACAEAPRMSDDQRLVRIRAEAQSKLR